MNYKYKLGNRRQEFNQAVKEHREKEIIHFFSNLNDFDVGQRLRKTYNFLKGFVNQKKRKVTKITAKTWESILKESEGPEIELCCVHDQVPLPNPPTSEEIRNIIQFSCNGKSPGSDKVYMEYIKNADEDSIETLVKIIQKIYIDNEMPKEWYKTTQIPIPKKTGANQVDHFRRISLCNVAYKIYAKWMAKQLLKFAGEPGVHQAAFTEKRSTDDHIFVARRVMEEYWNSGKDLIVLALDIRKAFDTVKVQCIKDILIGLSVPSRLVDRVLTCVKDEMTRVFWQFQYSGEIKRGKGIKQGCPLSPLLFNYLMQEVLTNVAKEIPELKLLDYDCLFLPLILAFADDLLIIARNLKELESVVAILTTELQKVGLSINYDKSQIMLRYPNNKAVHSEEVVLNGKTFKVSDRIKYLGVCLTSTLNRKLTNKDRCKNTLKTSRMIVDFCKKFRPSWELGKLMYKTVLAPALLYGTKVAVLTKKSRVSLANYEKLILRNIYSQCRKNDNSKFNAKKLLDGKTINRKCRVGRISYYGHILRREQNHPIRLAINLKFDKKKEGRPSLTWINSLNQDMNRYSNISQDEWMRLAEDREKIKSSAEEIYKEDNSEISDGEDSDEEKNSGGKYKHWTKMK